jgi:hypothetical protein
MAVPAVMTSSTMTTRPGERRADDLAALAVVLASLRLKAQGRLRPCCVRQRHAVVGDQRDALVGGPEQHVVGHAGALQRRGVALAQHGDRLAVVEQAGVEEVRAFAAGFEREARRSAARAPARVR